MCCFFIVLEQFTVWIMLIEDLKKYLTVIIIECYASLGEISWQLLHFPVMVI